MVRWCHPALHAVCAATVAAVLLLGLAPMQVVIWPGLINQAAGYPKAQRLVAGSRGELRLVLGKPKKNGLGGGGCKGKQKGIENSSCWAG